jgi:hypothetical protein
MGRVGTSYHSVVEALDKCTGQSKMAEIPRACPVVRAHLRGTSGFMSPKPPSPPPSTAAQQPCKHLRVQIVSRDEDAEFVECKDCGEIFESSEFKDMNTEERIRSREEF